MPPAYLKARSDRTPAFFCSKTAFPSRRLAMHAVNNHKRPHDMVAMGKGRLVVYRCASCKQYHLGHHSH